MRNMDMPILVRSLNQLPGLAGGGLLQGGLAKLVAAFNI